MDRWDVTCALGIALLACGLGLLAPWLGIASAGLLLLALGVAGALGAERSEEPPAEDTENEGKAGDA